MKCWPLDLRHLQRDSGFSAGFGAEGEPAYTLTSALTGGGNIPAVAVEYEGEDDEGVASGHAPPTEEREWLPRLWRGRRRGIHIDDRLRKRRLGVRRSGGV